MSGTVHLFSATVTAPPDRRRRCLVGGCRWLLPPTELLCRGHKIACPKRFRDALAAAWDGGRGAGTPALLAAAEQAADAVQARVARQQ